MKLHHTHPREIPDERVVRLKHMGNVIEVMHSDKRSFGGSITKLNKNEYMDNRTGEVKEIKHNETRADDVISVAKSLSRLRDYLNTNVTVPENCRWLTLTYAENMQDATKLKNDFKHFNKRCRDCYGQYEYIAAAEPQGRGAWHLHVVIIFPHHAPYMPNKDVAACWKQGFVTVRKLDNIDNVGAYLTAYLGDMELGEYKALYPAAPLGEIKEVATEGGNKRIVKGARLSMYPPGFHLYRCSKGIKAPKVSYMVYSDAKQQVLAGLKPTYRCSTTISDVNNGFENTITREYYNRKRKKENNK